MSFGLMVYQPLIIPNPVYIYMCVCVRVCVCVCVYVCVPFPCGLSTRVKNCWLLHTHKGKALLMN